MENRRNNPKLLFALVLTGITASAASLFLGQTNQSTGMPEPITVDNQTIEFTWTDENKGEDLLIYTDKISYRNSISDAVVYVAVENKSKQDQEIELLGYFRDDTKRISTVEVLTEITSSRPVYEAVTTCDSASTTKCNTVNYFVRDEQITQLLWQPLAKINRASIQKIEEAQKLQTVTRKTAESFEAKTKTISYEVPAGKVAYYRLHVVFPAGANDNFYLEAIGSKGGYGFLH